MRSPSLFLASLFIALTIVAGANAQSQKEVVPRFETADCGFPIPETEKNFRCGDLVVRENRHSKNGRTIRLPIIILKSTSANPKPDAVLRTLGGPGGSSLKLVRGRSSSPWLKDRDMIIFEQRGTKYARPALECPEVDAANAESERRRIGRKQIRLREVAAAKTCFDRLTGLGIDLSAYNSAESAADIEDLRRVLGIAKINLYGVSYSARLMLNVMRDHPSGIRTVVLESTLPPEIDYDEVGVDAIVRALDELFAKCRKDTECEAAYPDLEKEFYAVVKTLNDASITSSVKESPQSAPVDITLDGNDFATWIIDYLFSNEPAATVAAPYVIHQAFNGTFVDQFKRYAGDKISPSFYTWGMRYSVWCSEEMPFENRKRIDAQSTLYPGLNGYEVMALPDICSVWKVKHAAAIENMPVKSDIPTLVLAAEFDAYTPPAWGKTAGRDLKNSFFFEIPWAGHGPGFSVPCVHDMIAQFIDDPTAKPASDCVAKTSSQFKFLVKSP
jgi:pimeloyl-ACP methyl ester carboxylesterase